MDPGEFDEARYRASLLRKMRASEVVVYQAEFAPASVAAEPTLVAATSTGRLHVFRLRHIMEPQYWEKVERNEVSPRPTADLSFQAHPSQIYALAFAGDAANPVLLSGGDQELRVWRWRDIAAALDDPARAKTIEPVHAVHLHRQALGFRGALLPFNEVNDVAMCSATQHAFLAGGDAAAHEWDLSTQQFVRRFEGHDDFLHSVSYLQHSRELVTGSEDGAIGLWDARQARQAEFLRPQPVSGQTEPSALWVGCVAHDASEMWLACGGGKRRVAGRNGAPQRQQGGFMSVWHLPSRVPVHYTPTPSDVHDVAFHRMELLSVGNEASLKQWNRSSGALLATAHATLPSCHFCVVDEASDVVAVGGAAPTIDVYAMPGVVSFSLLVQDDV